MTYALTMRALVVLGVVAAAIAVILTITQVAEATPAYADAFAELHEQPVGQVHNIVGYTLPGGGDFTHVAVGTYDVQKWTMTGVVLLVCTASQCSGRRTGLGSADRIEVLGVIDLGGEPAALPASPVRGERLGGAKAKFPALVVRTTEKAARKLFIISLVDADRGSVIWQDTASTAGMRRSYRTEKSEEPNATALDIIATEKSLRCKTGPIEQRFKPSGHHYKTIEMPPCS